MARIRFYPEDNNLHPSDHIVGTDEVSGDGATRVFTVQALEDYLAATLGIEVPEALPPGFIPVSDGTGVFQPSQLQVKEVEDETGPTVVFTTNNVNGSIALFQGSLGGPRMLISPLVDGGFSPEPSNLEGLDFSATSGSTTITGNVGVYDREFSNVTDVDGFVGGFAYKYDLASASLSQTLPLASAGAVIPTSITFTIPGTSDLTLRRQLCINSDTVNLGDLEVMGTLRVDGVDVDLREVATNTLATGENQSSISDLEATKADIADLHEPVSIPDPTPAVEGVASTAIIGIDIDPTTQEITVRRGTVPVVIGGDGGGSDLSIGGIVTESIDFVNTGNVSFVTSNIGTASTVSANVNPSFLSGVESRLDAVESGSSLTVGSVSDVSVISIGDGITATPAAAGTVTLSTTGGGTIYFEGSDYTSPALDPFDAANSLLPNIISEGLTAVLPIPVTIGVNTYPSGVWIYAPNSTETLGVSDASGDWYQVANVSDSGVDLFVNLSDVDITGQADGDIIFWDLASQTWQSEAPGAILADLEVTLDYNYNDDERRVNSSEQGTSLGAQIPIAGPDIFGLVKLENTAIETIGPCDNPSTEYSFEALGGFQPSFEVVANGPFNQLIFQDGVLSVALDGNPITATFSGDASSQILNATGANGNGLAVVDNITGDPFGQTLVDGDSYYSFEVLTRPDPDVFLSTNVFNGSIQFRQEAPAGTYTFALVFGVEVVNEICIDASVEITGGLTINGIPIDQLGTTFSDDDATATADDTDRILPVLFDINSSGETTARVNASSLEFDITHGVTLPATGIAEQLFILETQSGTRTAGIYRYDGDLSAWVLVADNAAAGEGAVVYREEITVAADTWNINHNLFTDAQRSRPFMVQVYDDSYVQMIPEDVTQTDNNNLTITFAGSAQVGWVIITG